MPVTTARNLGIADHRPTRRRHLRRAERGAVLIEAAISLPLVVMTVLLVIEFSLVMRDVTALHGIGDAATRAASVAGNDLDADAQILEVVEESARPLPAGSLRRIVVYRALDAESTVPPACVTAAQDSAADQCNHYVAADLERPPSDFGCQGGLDLDRFWCPDERSVTVSVASGGPLDYVGVYIELERPLLTGLFGASLVVTSDDVIQIEPRNL